MHEILSIIPVLALVFCSLVWLICSMICMRTYVKLRDNYGELFLELHELKTKQGINEDHSRGQQKTILNHNDRIDKLTSQVAKILNNK